MDSGKRQSLKIVQIETRYIEIDAVNFRDVVQSLTGKDSTVDHWVANGTSMATKAESNITVTVKSDQDDSRTMLFNNMSLKEWEKLFSGIPCLDS